MNIEFITATTLADAWFQSIYRCVEVGRPFTIDKGSYAEQQRLEFDYAVIQIEYPNKELIPKLPTQYNIPDPVDEEFIASYIPYLMSDHIEENEQYTYGNRLWEFEQVQKVIDTYKEFGHRNNQMIMRISKPKDILLDDPPCLCYIDTRIQDNTLHLIPYFRSWDLWGGFPANLVAIETLKQWMADEIGVGNGSIIASSKGLHLYDYTWKLAECVRGKTIEEFKKGI